MYSDSHQNWGQPQQDPYYYYNQQPPGGGGGYGPASSSSSPYDGSGYGQPNYGQQPPGGDGGNFYNPMNNPAFNPMITNLAKQYGETLVGDGKKMMDEKFQKFVTVSKLKYYFAVDTSYVLKKLGLLLFPFTHKDWTIRFDKNEDNAVQPRNEVNAPDLYIPLMAFITFILVAGVNLGMQQRFSPELLGIQASSALGWLILELMVFTAGLYIIQTDLKVFDLMAFCSYKFVIMILSLLVCMVAGKMGYYSVLIYGGLSLAIFLVRTLKVQIYSVASHEHVVGGSKRRLYLLLSIAGVQPLLTWWLTYHLTRW